MARCRACQAEIEFIDTKAGKKMPVDRERRRLAVTPDGRDIGVSCENGETVHGKLMDPCEPRLMNGLGVPYVVIDVWVSHFATCPQADRFRKPR